MFDGIRNILMKRLVKKKEDVDKFTGPLCPRIQKRLELSIKDAVRCYGVSAGNGRYEVHCGPGHSHVVDTENRTCSCRNWDLSGIPCAHAVSVIREIGQNPQDYVHRCYLKTTQVAITNCLLKPVKGPKQWDPVPDMEPILPPKLVRPTGRPKKSRNKEPGEAPTVGATKLSRARFGINCSKCGGAGHNKATCRGQVKATTKGKGSGTTKGKGPTTAAKKQAGLISSNPPPPEQAAPSQASTGTRIAKLPIRKKKLGPPRTVQWFNSSPIQPESNVSNPPTQQSQTLKRPREE